MTTSNYGWNVPTVGADQDTWGDELNALAQAIDTQVKAVSESHAESQVSSGYFTTDQSSLIVALSPSYKAHRLQIQGCEPVQSSTYAVAYVSVDGGLTYLGANMYAHAGRYVSTDGTSGIFYDDIGDLIKIFPKVQTSIADYNPEFEMLINNAGGPNNKMRWSGSMADGSLSLVDFAASARTFNSVAATHLKIQMLSGNIRTGMRYSLHGIRGLT